MFGEPVRIEKKPVMPYFKEQPWYLLDTVVTNSHNIPKKLAQVVMLLTCTQDVCGLTLG
jgi:hypothetical protein